jgi:hypothetical protein
VAAAPRTYSDRRSRTTCGTGRGIRPAGRPSRRTGPSGCSTLGAAPGKSRSRWPGAPERWWRSTPSSACWPAVGRPPWHRAGNITWRQGDSSQLTALAGQRVHLAVFAADRAARRHGRPGPHAGARRGSRGSSATIWATASSRTGFAPSPGSGTATSAPGRRHGPSAELLCHTVRRFRALPKPGLHYAS